MKYTIWYQNFRSFINPRLKNTKTKIVNGQDQLIVPYIITLNNKALIAYLNIHSEYETEVETIKSRYFEILEHAWAT